jgi:hypothetical protein
LFTDYPGEISRLHYTIFLNLFFWLNKSRLCLPPGFSKAIKHYSKGVLEKLKMLNLLIGIDIKYTDTIRFKRIDNKFNLVFETKLENLERQFL